jgi:hypothetical protein
MPGLQKDRGVTPSRRLSEGDHRALWHLRPREPRGTEHIRLEEVHGVALGHWLVREDGR